MVKAKTKAKAQAKDDTVAKKTSKKGTSKKGGTAASKKKAAGKKAAAAAAAAAASAKAEPKAKKAAGKKAAAASAKAEPKAKKAAGKKAAAAVAKAEPKAGKKAPKKKVAKAEPKAKKAAVAKAEPKKAAGNKRVAKAEPKVKKAAGKKAAAAKAEPKAKKATGKKAPKKKAEAKAGKKTKAKKSKTKKGKAAKLTQAETVDKHLLYQHSVQSPEADIEFFVDRYHELRGKDPVVLREDFCGTSLISTTWAALGDDRRAVGVDLDAPTLQWAREHNLINLDDEARARVDLREANVLEGGGERADVTCAMNFSYGVFKTRPELRRYLEVTYEQLADDGVFITELYGGTEAIVQVTDEREVEDPTGEIGDFTYVWEQASYNPITHETLCYIHFELPDGSEMKRAFTYDWRLWSIPELRELLYDVGFTSVRVFWEATDEDGDGTGEYYATEKEDNQESWLVYIVAAK